MLLEHTLTVLQPLCAEHIVVLNDPQDWAGLPAHLVRDCYADSGPLGAIYTGLSAATHPYALIVAADMPLLNLHLLRAMLEHPTGYDALVPHWPQPNDPDHNEPLHAVYSRTCLPILQKALEQGTRRVRDVLPLLRVAYLAPEEIARHDSQGLSFLNINTPADLARAWATLQPSAPEQL
jgi:molybdopterin-guanine dinucleotide biosynthesis protein A